MFLGELTVFTGTWSDGLGRLVVVAAFNMAASSSPTSAGSRPPSALRAARPPAAGQDGPRQTDRWAAGTAVGAAALPVGLGIAAAPVLEVLPHPLLR